MKAPNLGTNITHKTLEKHYTNKEQMLRTKKFTQYFTHIKTQASQFYMNLHALLSHMTMEIAIFCLTGTYGYKSVFIYTKRQTIKIFEEV